MKVLIAIPSKKRAEVLKKNALVWLIHIESVDWKVFIEKEDFLDYARILPADKLVILEETNQGLGYAKTIIKNYALNNGYDFIFKVDDDIKGWTDFRKTLEPKESAEKCEGFVKIITQYMKETPAIGAVSFPYSFQMFSQFDYKKTKRVQTAYITNVEDFYADPKVSVFEDFAVGLSVMVKGKMVLYYGESGISMGVKVGGGEGGHQSFDRQERAMKEIEELRKIYPPLAFRKVNKIWCYEPDLKSVKIGFYL